jgi:hypothetical protein
MTQGGGIDAAEARDGLMKTRSSESGASRYVGMARRRSEIPILGNLRGEESRNRMAGWSRKMKRSRRNRELSATAAPREQGGKSLRSAAQGFAAVTHH